VKGLEKLLFVRLSFTASLLQSLPVEEQHLNLDAHNEDFAGLETGFGCSQVREYLPGF
jgi:hypothetical protein